MDVRKSNPAEHPLASKLKEQGTTLDGPLEQLAPGVRGYAIAHGDAIYVPWIDAVKEGSGDVGRFLDSLPPGTKIPNVISDRLVGMLQRRGWQKTYEAPNGEAVDVWVC